jgi:hypothetical protein
LSLLIFFLPKGKQMAFLKLQLWLFCPRYQLSLTQVVKRYWNYSLQIWSYCLLRYPWAT